MICRRRVGQFKDRRGASGGANFGYLWTRVEPPGASLGLACHLLWHLASTTGALAFASPGPQAACRTRRLAEYICTAGATRRRGGLRYFVRAVSISPCRRLLCPPRARRLQLLAGRVWLAGCSAFCLGYGSIERISLRHVQLDPTAHERVSAIEGVIGGLWACGGRRPWPNLPWRVPARLIRPGDDTDSALSHMFSRC